MKDKGWMVNFAMRRVEQVHAEQSPFNRADYGRYRGPKRTYMLYDDQVHGSELIAMHHLCCKMRVRHKLLSDQLRKYTAELESVKKYVDHLIARESLE